MKYLIAITAIATGTLPNLVNSQSCEESEQSCKFYDDSGVYVGECCGDGYYCHWAAEPNPKCVPKPNPIPHGPTNFCEDALPVCRADTSKTLNPWVNPLYKCYAATYDWMCITDDDTIGHPAHPAVINKSSDYCDCDLGRSFCDTGINPCADPSAVQPIYRYNPKDDMTPAERNNQCLFDDYIGAFVPHCCENSGYCNYGCDHPNDCSTYGTSGFCACEKGKQYCETGTNPCSDYSFDDDAFDDDVQAIYDDTYGDDDYSQEDEEYMAYIVLTVEGKLHKLSDDYCPEGLKSSTPDTISNIESAADVNLDYALSPSEYEGMLEIVANYCNDAGSGGSGKSGKKDSGRGAGVKRKRGQKKNLFY